MVQESVKSESKFTLLPFARCGDLVTSRLASFRRLTRGPRLTVTALGGEAFAGPLKL
jgi:hypothetical protein